MFKRFMRSNAVQIIAGWLVAAYITFVKYTTRWEVEHADHIQEIIDGGKGFIALTWHSRFMMLTAAWKKNYQRPYILISRSRDGAIVAHASHFLGAKTIRGSAKKAAKGNMAAKAKGGAKASIDIVTALKTKACIVITPDGPRGPRQRMGDGPIRLARATGTPIVTCTFAIRNRKQLNSWDKLIFPLPFGKGKIIWGPPITVPSDADEHDIEHIRKRVESEMNIFLTDADRAMGHAPTQAADT